MLRDCAMMSSHNPSLRFGEDQVDHGQMGVGFGHVIANHKRLMTIAELR